MHADVSGPRPWFVGLTGSAALVAVILAPGLAPMIAAIWLVLLASRVRLRVSGGGTPPISSRELTEWMAYYGLEPWGSEVDDHRFGTIASTIANVNRDPKKRGKPYEPQDFFPLRDQSEESIEDNGAKWASFFAPFTKR